MTTAEILAQLKQALPDLQAEEQKGQVGDSSIFIEPADVVRVMEAFRNQLGFEYLACLAGVDYQPALGVTYQLRSIAHKAEVMVKTQMPRNAAEVETISHLYAVAGWFEREAYDLMGITFKNHPDLRRLLMPEDWKGHPLRKDYQYPKEYHGIPFDRPDTHELLDRLSPPKPKPVSSEKPVEAKTATQGTVSAKEGQPS